jgi:4-coumarate--CoA ligase
MPYKSRWKVPVPCCSLPTFLFGPSKDVEKPISMPDKLAFADAANPEAYHITREEFRQWSLRFARGLTDSGLFKKGDRLLFFSSNNLFVPVALMGTLCAGGIFTGANPTFTPRELAHQLSDSGAAILLCTDANIDIAIEAAKQAGMDRSRVFVFNADLYDGKGSGIKGCRYWGDLMSSPAAAKTFKWDDLNKPGEEHTTLALNYSSGTTGVPKGVEITHYNYISNTLQAAQIAENHVDWPRRKEITVGLCFLPLYHAYGQTVYVAGMMHRQAPVYVMAKFDFIEVLGYIQRYRITDLTLVPPIAVALAKHPDVSKYDLTSIHTIGCGAAPLGRDVSEQVEKRLNAQRKDPETHVNMKQGKTSHIHEILHTDQYRLGHDGMHLLPPRLGH